MNHGNELGVFLKSRRAKVAPQSVGLPSGARRRVAGLRREEVALLAGISVEYYQRLEQGRANRPSDEVLDSIAAILGLTEVETSHLYQLAVPRRRAAAAEPVVSARPELVRMLGLMDRVPALIINDRFDVLGLNPMAALMFPGVVILEPPERNLARFLFLDPAGRDFYLEWDQVAAATVAQLRLATGTRPSDQALTDLINDLSHGSPAFARLWQRGDVDIRTHGVKSFRHPDLGVLTVNYENLTLAGETSQRVVAFNAEPDSATQAAFALLTKQAEHNSPASGQTTGH